MALAGWPKLLTAAYAGQTEEVESILEAKADPNETDSLGRTALMHAAAQGHAEVVDVLIQAGTDVGFSHSADGRTALHWAAAHGFEECCALLQAAGGDVDEEDRDGFTPQALAVEGGSPFLLSPGDPPASYKGVVAQPVPDGSEQPPEIKAPPADAASPDKGERVPTTSSRAATRGVSPVASRVSTAAKGSASPLPRTPAAKTASTNKAGGATNKPGTKATGGSSSPVRVGRDSPKPGGRDSPKPGGRDSPKPGGRDSPKPGGRDSPKPGGRDSPKP